MLAQLLSLRERQPHDRRLHEVVIQLAPVAQGVAVGYFDDQAGSALKHERQTVAAGDDVRMDGLAEHEQAVLKRLLPEPAAPGRQIVATPHIVDQDVQAAALFLSDAVDQALDLCRLGVIDAQRDS